MANYFFLPVKDELIFEGSRQSIDFGRDKSIRTIKLIKKLGIKEIVIIPQTNSKDPEIKDKKSLREFGTICEISEIETQDNANATIFKLKILGFTRVKLVSFSKYSDEDLNPLDVYFANFKKSKIKINDDFEETIEIWKELKNIPEIKKILFSSKQNPTIQNELEVDGDELYESITWSNRMTIISTLVPLFKTSFDFKYKLFSSIDLNDYLRNFINVAKQHDSLIKIDREIDEDVRKKLDEQQKEFLLRERMKAIRNKLGEQNDAEDRLEQILDSDELKNMIPEEVRILIQNEKSKLKGMMSSSPDANIVRSYIQLLSELPWRQVTKEKLDIDKAKKILESYHHGLKDVKERIIEFIAVMINNQEKNKKEKKDEILSKGDLAIDLELFNKVNGINVSSQKNPAPIITLLGPPGTGKTSLAKAIAEALGKKFIKISLGGVKDEAEIRGHRRTYIGAMPGKIITAIKKAGVSNPLILLDEIDKMSSDYKGDPSSAMLEVLDPEQNANFQDHYLEVEYDLSKVMFLATANYYENIPSPLLDRVELIELSSYTVNEKINIAEEYLIKTVLKQNSLENKFFKISKKELEFLIKHYTMEAGVRNFKRVLDKIARKIILRLIEGKIKDKFVITKENIEEFLGPIKFAGDENDIEPQIGSVNGLAYTSYGGSTLAIEVTTFKGKGELKLTGQLKDVMQESAQIAIAYVRSNAEKFDINFDWDENSIHIHVPEGAVPKDGPSAGVTFTTAIISALSKKPVSHLIGMTGEITLRGKVLPIGGLKEKSIAGFTFGIRTIFIPKENERNLVDVPEEIRKKIKFIPVSSYDEIYEIIFKNKKSKKVN